MNSVYPTVNAQKLDYMLMENPRKWSTSIAAFGDRLVLSQAKEGKLSYNFFILGSDFVPGPARNIRFSIPVSNTTGLLRVRRLSDGSFAVLGRRPGGETFVSRWTSSFSPMWTYRLKSGDSPDLPQRDLFIYDTDTIGVVDIIHVNNTTKRLLLTVLDKDGQLAYSHSFYRKNVDWTKMNADCNGKDFWICAQPKTDTSSLLSWSTKREEVAQIIDIPGYDIDNVKILPDGNLLVAGVTVNTATPILAILDPTQLTVRRAIKITTVDPIPSPEIQLGYDAQSIYLDIQGEGDTLRHILRLDTGLQVLSSFTINTRQISKSLILGNRYFTLAADKTTKTPIICRYDPDEKLPKCRIQDFCFDLEPIHMTLLKGRDFSLFTGSVLRSLTIALSAASTTFRDTCLEVADVPFADFDIDRDTVCVGDCVRVFPLGNDNAETWEWKVEGPKDSIWSRVKDPGCFRYEMAGTYLMKQTIKFFGCLYEAQKTVFVSDEWVNFDIPDLFLCPGGDTTITLPMGLKQIQWENGSTNPIRTFDRSGHYSMEAVNSAGCLVKDSFVVYEITSPEVKILPGDTLICEEDSLSIGVAFTPGTAYQWSTGATTPKITVRNAGVYTVTATNRCGQSSDTIEIQVKPCKVRVYIPNVFTPNGDGINDVFEVFLHNASFISMEIFDRWGNLVYSASGGKEPWNGTDGKRPYPAGVYVYTFQYKDIFSSKVLTRSGSITLVR